MNPTRKIAFFEVLECYTKEVGVGVNLEIVQMIKAACVVCGQLRDFERSESRPEEVGGQVIGVCYDCEPPVGFHEWFKE